MGAGIVLRSPDPERPLVFPALSCALRYWQHRRQQWSSFESVFSGVFSASLVVHLAGQPPQTVGARFPHGVRGAPFTGHNTIEFFDVPERIGEAILRGELVRVGESWGDPHGEKIGELLEADGVAVELMRHHARLRSGQQQVWLEAADLRGVHDHG